MTEKETTTIVVTRENQRRLFNLKEEQSDTFNDVIGQLLDMNDRLSEEVVDSE